MSRIDRVGADMLTLDMLGLSHALAMPSQGWLDLLPLPAGVVEIIDGELQLVRRNSALARVCAVPDPSYLFALRERIRETVIAAEQRIEFPWIEPGPAGRHFQAHLARLGGGDAFLLTLIDRTAAVETERNLRFQMLHDSLTGFPNRLAFAEAVEAALDADEGAHRVALIALDLVRFSRINESIGAIAGDELIITVARRLLEAIPGGALLARTSGDEFSLLLRLEEGPGDMLHIARKLRASLAEPLRLSEIELSIDAAIGCALSHDESADAADLMRNAQFALKRAKQTRRIEVYHPEAARAARRRFSLETELRHAIERDELTLAYQPLIDLRTREVKGFEALARWTHPTRGAISPADFIPVAEESGLIVPLGRWVLDRAVRQLAEWDAKLGGRQDFYVSVNVSPVQLQCDAVAEVVAGVLERHGIEGSRLTLELTESSIIANPDRAALLLEALKDMSCRLAMDDFGTGYSNLAYLQRLPIDVLKIDRKFVTNMLDDGDSTAIVRAILSLAAALGMTTIAEGIETQPVAATLAALGCQTGQGYHFARPLTPDVALELLGG